MLWGLRKGRFRSGGGGGPERRKRPLPSAKTDGGRSSPFPGECRSAGPGGPLCFGTRGAPLGVTPSGSAWTEPRLRARTLRPGSRQRLVEHIPGLPNTGHAAGAVVQGVPHPLDIGRVHLPEVRGLRDPVPHQARSCARSNPAPTNGTGGQSGSPRRAPWRPPRGPRTPCRCRR